LCIHGLKSWAATCLNSSLQQGKQLSAEISAPAGHPRCVLLSVLRSIESG
jgi:hypothetical protein